MNVNPYLFATMAAAVGIATGQAVSAYPVVQAWLAETGSTGLQAGLVSLLASFTKRASKSATKLGQNHDVVKLIGDAAEQVVREHAEAHAPLWNPLKWGERWSAEHLARKISGSWADLDESNLLQSCTSSDLLEWFHLTKSPGQTIPSPLTKHQWKVVIKHVVPQVDDQFADALAQAFFNRFTHFVREEFKRDCAGERPDGGKAYASLQMAASGATLEAVATASQQILDNKKILQRFRHEVLKLGRETQKLIDEARDEQADLVALLGQSLRDVKSAFEELHGPRLKLLTADPDSETRRHVFWNERLALVGRTQELLDLDSFMRDHRIFCWDLWTGPAGSGKSRIALDLAKGWADRWQTGFYQWSFDRFVAWDTWQPQRDCLIVFDYASLEPTKLGEAIGVLSRRGMDKDDPHSLGCKVRFLLLDREIARSIATSDVEEQATAKEMPPPPWLTDLIGAGYRSAGPLFGASHHGQNADQPERPIGGLSPEAVEAIIENDAGLNGFSFEAAEIKRRADLAVKIDPMRRPLYIALAAEAMRESGDAVATWSSRDLVDAVLIRERRLWDLRLKARGIDVAARRRFVHLACVATMCGGLQTPELKQVLGQESQHCLPALGDWNTEIYQQIVDSSNLDTAPKVEPDLIGEAFVLSELQDSGLCRDLLLSRAADLGMGDFLLRAANNFPIEDSLEELLQSVSEDLPDDVKYANAVRLQTLHARGSYEQLAELGISFAGDAKQDLETRSAGFFSVMCTDWAKHASDNDLNDLLSIVDHLIENDSENDDFAVYIASGLFNASFDAGANSNRADDLFDRLEALAKRHPDNTEIALHAAEALLHALGHADGDPSRSDQLLDRLEAISRRHPKNAEIAAVVAKALFNACVDAGVENHRANGLLKRLEAISRSHPDNAEIAVDVAKRLFSVSLNATGDSDRANDLLDRLDATSRRHPKNTEVAVEVAKGLFNASVDAGADSHRADDLLDRLNALAQRHSENAEIAAVVAKALYNASVNARADTHRANDLLDRLETLAKRYRENSEVAAVVAKGLFNASVDAEPDSNRANGLLDRLEALAKRHPENAEIAAVVAKGLFNASVDAGADSHRADDLLDRLQALATSHPKNAAIAYDTADAHFIALGHARRDLDRSDQLLNRLESIARNHPKNVDIAAVVAKGLFNASVDAGEDDHRAEDLLERLEALAQEHPENV